MSRRLRDEDVAILSHHNVLNEYKQSVPLSYFKNKVTDYDNPEPFSKKRLTV